jgi:hypothetical protein
LVLRFAKMRFLAATAPLLVLATGVFFACGSSTAETDGGKTDASDAPSDQPIGDSGEDTNDGGIQCTFAKDCTNFVDPVDFCILRSVLLNQHQIGFTPTAGTYASWNYLTLSPDVNPATKAKIHDFHDDAAYGASCAAFHNWAVLYSDPQELDADLEALAPILEAELKTLPAEYDGELYFNLRSVADGLTNLDYPSDAAKINAIADKYARQIFSTYSFDLPLAGSDGGSAEGGAEAGGGSDGGADGSADGGPADSGMPDATSSSDAGGDPRYAGDGIIGVNQEPSTGVAGILYQPASVASAAYALIDLAQRNPADSDYPMWIAAARKALDHIHNRARDSVTGLYYSSLFTTGGITDPLGSLSTPTNLLSTEVQAKVLLYLLNSQQLVVASTMPSGGGGDGDGAVDAGELGTLKSLEDFPFLPRTTSLLGALQFLWDGAYTAEGGIAPVPLGDTGFGGFMDGYLPSTSQVLTTKTTRTNAYMFAVMRLQFIATTGPLEGIPPTPAEGEEGQALRVLLSNEDAGSELMNFTPNRSFLSVVTSQQAYFETATQGFKLPKNTSETPTAQSYTAADIAAVVQGFNAQLIGFHP